MWNVVIDEVLKQTKTSFFSEGRFLFFGSVLKLRSKFYFLQLALND